MLVNSALPERQFHLHRYAEVVKAENRDARTRVWTRFSRVSTPCMSKKSPLRNASAARYPCGLKIYQFGVPYGNRTRVAAVKEKGITLTQGNFAAWIALYRT